MAQLPKLHLILPNPLHTRYSSIYFIWHPRHSSPFANFLLSRACLQCSSLTASFLSRIEEGRWRVPVSVNIKPQTTASLKLGKEVRNEIGLCRRPHRCRGSPPREPCSPWHRLKWMQTRLLILLWLLMAIPTQTQWCSGYCQNTIGANNPGVKLYKNCLKLIRGNQEEGN